MNDKITRRRVAGVAIALLILAAAGGAYVRRSAELGATKRPAATDSGVAAQNGVDGPPAGRWRLAPQAELNRVLLFTAHVLVRHRGSLVDEAPFAPPSWMIMPAAPQRSREHARDLALAIAARVRREPQRFAALARELSEDPLTRDGGGALGPIGASQLLFHPNVLDAFAQLAPGETSGVVETGYGFHVFQRLAPPSRVELSGRHLVIGHDQTIWLDPYRRAGRDQARSRSEALAIARGIKTQLDAIVDPKERDEAFTALIDAHSEHRDAEQHGDLGVWSTHESTHLRWQLATVSELTPFEISAPIDTPLGVELIERVEPTPRQALAMTTIKLPFNLEAAADAPEGRAAVLRRASSIAALVQKRPDRFAEWQKQYCCARVETWTVGRGEPELTRVLQALPIDGVAAEPVVVWNNVVLARRAAPQTAPEVCFALPAPSEPDLDYLVANAHAASLANYVRSLPRALASVVKLSDAQAKAIEARHTKLADVLEDIPADQRVRALYAAQLELRSELGDALYQEYMRALRAEVSRMLMLARG